MLDRDLILEAVSDGKMPRPDRGTDPFAPASGLLWWVNEDRVWPSLPPDAVVGAGAGHQVLLVVPSLDLIAVRYGKSELGAEDGDRFWSALEAGFFRPLSEAITRNGS